MPRFGRIPVTLRQLGPLTVPRNGLVGVFCQQLVKRMALATLGDVWALDADAHPSGWDDDRSLRAVRSTVSLRGVSFRRESTVCSTTRISSNANGAPRHRRTPPPKGIHM